MTASLRPQHVGDIALAAIADSLIGVALRVEDRTATVRGVTLDSRSVQPGDLYAALPGARAHGADFVAQAVASGASAVLTDPAGVQRISTGVGAAAAREAARGLPPLLVADDPRAVLGKVSALVYGRPADDLTMIGITGTNGKTTTAHLLEGALRAAGRSTGLIGTIETRIGTQRVPSVRTTPEATQLHGLLAVMVERGCEVCCMEVSSHALDLHRVDGVRYDIAIFTNLSQDHLDFHGSMEAYFQAKAQLFTPQHSRHGIVCVDDAWGRRLAAEAPIEVTTLTASAGGTADWVLIDAGLLASRSGARSQAEPRAGDVFGLDGPDGLALELVSCLPGDHNRTNTALAALALLELGLSPAHVETAIAAGAQVPGRMQRVELGAGAPLAYVDFAHTPEAVTATLTALRGRRSGPLVAVLGAGGDRDPGKRAAMGRAAAANADVVVVTDDNPRHEEPAAIRAAVAGGAREVDPHLVHDVPGRVHGIALALRLAAASAPGLRTDDRAPHEVGTVAVLGKGHEQGQTIGDTTTPFDDAQVLRARWVGLRGGAPGGDAQEAGLEQALDPDTEVRS